MLDNNLFIANGEIFPLWRSTSTAPILGALNASWLPVNMFCRGIDYYLNHAKKKRHVLAWTYVCFCHHTSPSF